MVGAVVDSVEGAAVGATVGVAVDGAAVGGGTVGAVDGASEGAHVSPTPVGVRVDGDAEGAADDGAAEGAGEVGDALVNVEGAVVGAAVVGAAVGCHVCPMAVGVRVEGADVVGAEVVGAEVVGAAVVGEVEAAVVGEREAAVVGELEAAVGVAVGGELEAAVGVEVVAVAVTVGLVEGAVVCAAQRDREKGGQHTHASQLSPWTPTEEPWPAPPNAVIRVSAGTTQASTTQLQCARLPPAFVFQWPRAGGGCTCRVGWAGTPARRWKGPDAEGILGKWRL